MKEINKLGLLRFLCGLFYSGLCIFSIIVGLYYCISNNALNQIELSQTALDTMTRVIPVSVSLFFGILTILVGIAQGVSAYGIFSIASPKLYRFAVGFTVFSLLSCSSKLFMSINAFSICKIVAYIAVLFILIKNRSKSSDT